jgi:hypothetical protein
LNLRPPGYEPGELPDCSTPRREGQYSWHPVAKGPKTATCARGRPAQRLGIEPPIEFRDVTTIMNLIAHIHEDVAKIRKLLEDEFGEEEEVSEDDA